MFWFWSKKNEIKKDLKELENKVSEDYLLLNSHINRHDQNFAALKGFHQSVQGDISEMNNAQSQTSKILKNEIESLRKKDDVVCTFEMKNEDRPASNFKKLIREGDSLTLGYKDPKTDFVLKTIDENHMCCLKIDDVGIGENNVFSTQSHCVDADSGELKELGVDNINIQSGNDVVRTVNVTHKKKDENFCEFRIVTQGGKQVQYHTINPLEKQSMTIDIPHDKIYLTDASKFTACCANFVVNNNSVQECRQGEDLYQNKTVPMFDSGLPSATVQAVENNNSPVNIMLHGDSDNSSVGIVGFEPVAENDIAHEI